ncbi:hypothetical protein AAY473_013060 [Plecturocebus cupreus]
MREWQHLHGGCAGIGADFQHIGRKDSGTYSFFERLYAFLEMVNVIRTIGQYQRSKKGFLPEGERHEVGTSYAPLPSLTFEKFSF